MSDYGLKVILPATKDGGKDQVLLNSQYPLAKLDTTNDTSFTNIRLQIRNDLPNDATTQVYSFKHGYDYIPATWLVFNRTFGLGNQSGGVDRVSPYAYEGGILTASGTGVGAAFARVGMTVDTSSVNITITKYSGFPPDNVNLAGYSLLIRVYVFTEDITPRP